MKILVDDQFFSRQKFGGISRYHFELYNELNNIANTSCNISALYSHNEYLKQEKKFNRPVLSPIFFSQKITRTLNRAYSILRLKEQFYDVFHPTYYDPYFLSYLKNKPFVVTIHDMIPELFPEYFKNHDLVQNKKKLLEASNAIIAVSNNTKADLIKFYQIPENKIKVIYHGFRSIEITDRFGDNLSLPDKFILYVGERADYKNFIFFLESVKDILKKNHIHLICAGGRRFTTSEMSFIKEHKLESLLLQLNVSDKQLYQLYNKAILFAFPTLYEGFGIPILEAFHNQCPVMASRRGSIPEIAGDAAAYFDPLDKHSISATFENLLHDPIRLKNLRLKGSEIVKLFNWAKTAKETLNVYESVI